MNQTIPISITSLLLIYIILVIPFVVVWRFRIGLMKNIFISMFRMSVQLFLIGLYLKFIFELNSFWVNILWIAIMICVANYSLLKNTRLPIRFLFPWTFLGLAISTVAVTAMFVWGVLSPVPFYDARYNIPIFGMILGNCMNGNTVSLERFFSGVLGNEKEFLNSQMLGASLSEATLPFAQKALFAGMSPQLASVATMGLVSLPGMMTGQLLSGAVPMTAIAYQIAIIVCIFSSMTLGMSINLAILRKICFTKMGMIKQEFISYKQK